MYSNDNRTNTLFSQQILSTFTLNYFLKTNGKTTAFHMRLKVSAAVVMLYKTFWVFTQHHCLVRDPDQTVMPAKNPKTFTQPLSILDVEAVNICNSLEIKRISY
jgi:hypothetical protein